MSGGGADEADKARIEKFRKRLFEHPEVDSRYKNDMMRALLPAFALIMNSNIDVSTREDLLERRMQDLVKLAKIVKSMEKPPKPPQEIRALWAGNDIEQSQEEIVSQPDGNSIKLSVIKPSAASASQGPLPCVMYIHGGGMATNSAFNPEYQVLGRILAKQGLVVVLPDFRNCEMPTPSNPEVAPFPAGLNDCYSALQWIHDNKAALGIDDRIIVAGESGGGNLTLAVTLKALKEGRHDLVQHGIYAMCPYIAGRWPQDVTNNGILGTSHLNSVNNGIFLEMAGNNVPALGYGIEALRRKDPLAWPAFAADEDLKAFPRTVIQVNEFDPLRDEGIVFYRRLVKAGVRATCKELRGTIHGASVMVTAVPEVTLDTCASIAAMAKMRPLGSTPKL
ncbi:Arylacetamide deacetylase [Hondaea fermentalgiana]|uniref:Arylacetamide deacetylase n=1 Tax=Hondaea fermentalgiana TaxID=2315210 RepID=A0A2R5H0U7_9STRA|nr:Arylacetamide deacetylase [Hondaea fermentalgiana]|eukprot:GBG33944.1 Arylacetamide deacetylase [Hondaea fermentalgiana]